MADHLHLFASPGEPELALEAWEKKYWKSQFSKRHNCSDQRWQTDHWDTRIRGEENYEAKWQYAVGNPVRHGLVTRPEDWPFQGEIFPLR